jgi:hypothetical protein
MKLKKKSLKDSIIKKWNMEFKRKKKGKKIRLDLEG